MGGEFGVRGKRAALEEGGAIGLRLLREQRRQVGSERRIVAGDFRQARAALRLRQLEQLVESRTEPGPGFLVHAVHRIASGPSAGGHKTL